MLLEDRYTLPGICEELHKQGYRYKSGRPFIEVKDNGSPKANYNTLASYHNWTYAGWVTSKTNNVPPKTIRGNWEPIVTTEELERGLAILDNRNQKRNPNPNRKHDYLLGGLVYYRDVDRDIRLTCSKVNSGRQNGGTAYYRIAGRNVRFLCQNIDLQIAIELNRIQIDSEYTERKST